MRDSKGRRRSPVEQAYPSVARWVMDHGWIEIGQDQASRSFVRALDEGGQVWEGDATYPTIDDALRALEAALAQWIQEQFGR